MGWLLGAFVTVLLPGLWLLWWLTGDDYRGVHRHAPYVHRHAVPLDLDGPTMMVDRKWYYRPH